MKPSQAFGVVVRTIGLLAWLGALYYGVETLIFVFAPRYHSNTYPWWQYLASAAFFFLVGWFLLRGADRFVAFAYRLRTSDASDA